MKRLILSLFSVSLLTTAHAQTRQDFEKAINRFQTFLNNEQTDSIYSMLSERGKTMMPIEKAKQAFIGLHKQLGTFKSYEFINQESSLATCKSFFDNGVLTLFVSLNSEMLFENLRFLPYKDKSEVSKSSKTNFTLKTQTGNINGTLEIPDVTSKMPVVLIIAGSGPTDRDCNNALGAKTNAFLMLADSLKKAGIASLRYDKRGVGESAAAAINSGNGTLDELISDASGCIKMLKADPRFSSVYVLGHSEGSLVGMVAANREQANGYISLSGAGRTTDKLIREQLDAQSKEMGAKAGIIMDSIKKGYKVLDVPEELSMLFNPGVQPFLRSCMKYDPIAEIKKLKIPVMIAQGTTDLQIAVKDAELLKKAVPKAKLTLVEGMNHILKQAPADREQNFATYNNPELPLSAGVANAIVSFIKTGK
jgi:hypothetical protein